MMMFLFCPKCKKRVDDRNAIMLSNHFPWVCPHCETQNEPIGAPQEMPESADIEPTEELATVEEGWAFEREGGSTAKLLIWKGQEGRDEN